MEKAAKVEYEIDIQMFGTAPRSFFYVLLKEKNMNTMQIGSQAAPMNKPNRMSFQFRVICNKS